LRGQVGKCKFALFGRHATVVKSTSYFEFRLAPNRVSPITIFDFSFIVSCFYLPTNYYLNQQNVAAIAGKLNALARVSDFSVFAETFWCNGRALNRTLY
jgi:hypothetical protein